MLDSIVPVVEVKTLLQDLHQYRCLPALIPSLTKLLELQNGQFLTSKKLNFLAIRKSPFFGIQETIEKGLLLHNTFNRLLNSGYVA